ncbi:UNVERIFIED_CONTAM: hypothetical protein Sradi_6366600 [Sesamum radiatum]|uniref:DUF4408 domain-containing protein n=1 Tax=Sesamum radiatum TaxID=300843 RepID=A0AAW2K3F9_SESRA
MDQNADCIIETSTTPPQNHHHLMMIGRAFLQFLVPLSIFSFLVSYYFPGFPFFFFIPRNLHQLLPLVAQALDRKYMFLICNGILAFLAKNLKLSSSGLNGLIMKNAEEGEKQMSDLPEILGVQENAASMEYVGTPSDVAVPEENQVMAVAQQEQDCEGLSEGEPEETNADGLILESDEWEVEEGEEEMEESRGAESTIVSDANVSTEELNRKFEEFIRKMKEEIRIEARQQLIAV